MSDPRDAQIQALQERCSELLEEKRSHDESAHVRQFHRASGSLPVRFMPAVPATQEVRFRFFLELEEFLEGIEAGMGSGADQYHLGLARNALKICIGKMTRESVDFEKLVDAWADQKYIIYGSELTYGVDGAAVFRLVHAANMQKFELPGGGLRPDGKVLKPPGWRAPDIAGELARQREEEAKRA